MLPHCTQGEVLLKRFPPQIIPLSLHVSCLSKVQNLRTRPDFLLDPPFQLGRNAYRSLPDQKPIETNHPQIKIFFWQTYPAKPTQMIWDLYKSSQTSIQVNTTANGCDIYQLLCKVLLPPSLPIKSGQVEEMQV